MKNKELENIECYYNHIFPKLKIFKSISDLSGVPVNEKVYESLSGDYFYGTIIPYTKAEVENSNWFKLVEK